MYSTCLVWKCWRCQSTYTSHLQLVAFAGIVLELEKNLWKTFFFFISGNWVVVLLHFKIPLLLYSLSRILMLWLCSTSHFVFNKGSWLFLRCLLSCIYATTQCNCSNITRHAVADRLNVSSVWCFSWLLIWSRRIYIFLRLPWQYSCDTEATSTLRCFSNYRRSRKVLLIRLTGKKCRDCDVSNAILYKCIFFWNSWSWLSKVLPQ